MDLGTLIGMILGTFFIVGGILISSELMAFFDLTSIFITIGGTFAATMVAFPLNNVMAIVNLFKKVFLTEQINPGEYIQSLVTYATKARKEGVLSLENDAENEEDEFLKTGLRLAIDGVDGEIIMDVLEAEIDALEGRHGDNRGIFEMMGTLAPAFGMIGTLIGLVAMLRTLSDPSSIGPKMAVALITTLYGAVLANLFFIPMANKLKKKTTDEVMIKNIVVQGILAIQSGENPRTIESKLLSNLPASMRSEFATLE